MEYKPNPTCKSGFKNIYCPYYGFCLDHAAKHFWNFWECGDCVYRSVKKPFEVEHFLDNDEIPYCSLSPEIYQKLSQV